MLPEEQLPVFVFGKLWIPRGIREKPLNIRVPVPSGVGAKILFVDSPEIYKSVGDNQS
jgi:hypothetical protein